MGLGATQRLEVPDVVNIVGKTFSILLVTTDVRCFLKDQDIRGLSTSVKSILNIKRLRKCWLPQRKFSKRLRERERDHNVSNNKNDRKSPNWLLRLIGYPSSVNR